MCGVWRQWRFKHATKRTGISSFIFPRYTMTDDITSTITQDARSLQARTVVQTRVKEVSLIASSLFFCDPWSRRPWPQSYRVLVLVLCSNTTIIGLLALRKSFFLFRYQQRYIPHTLTQECLPFNPKQSPVDSWRQHAATEPCPQFPVPWKYVFYATKNRVLCCSIIVRCAVNFFLTFGHGNGACYMSLSWVCTRQIDNF